MYKESLAFPGRYEVYATEDGMRAEIRDQISGKVIKRYRGETAHMDAAREAEDLNLGAQR